MYMSISPNAFAETYTFTAARESTMQCTIARLSLRACMRFLRSAGEASHMRENYASGTAAKTEGSRKDVCCKCNLSEQINL